MPKYRFKWSNLPPSLLRALCGDLLGLNNHDEDAAAALQRAYGARPTTEFIRDAWSALLESWLSTAADHRERVVQALQEARTEKGVIKGSRAQMTYLRGLRNSKTLRETVWSELVAAGEEQLADAPQRKEQPRKRSALATPTSPEALPTTDTTTAVDAQVLRRQKKPQQEKSLEATLWEAADRLRSRVDAAEYKHVVLGLIFLKYVSDVFTRRREALQRLVDDAESEYFMSTDEAKQSVLEDRDEYASEGVFWVPEGHRWEDLRKAAKQTDIGERIDAAMDAVER